MWSIFYIVQKKIFSSYSKSHITFPTTQKAWKSMTTFEWKRFHMLRERNKKKHRNFSHGTVMKPVELWIAFSSRKNKMFLREWKLCTSERKWMGNLIIQNCLTCHEERFRSLAREGTYSKEEKHFQYQRSHL